MFESNSGLQTGESNRWRNSVPIPVPRRSETLDGLGRSCSQVKDSGGGHFLDAPRTDTEDGAYNF